MIKIDKFEDTAIGTIEEDYSWENDLSLNEINVLEIKACNSPLQDGGINKLVLPSLRILCIEDSSTPICQIISPLTLANVKQLTLVNSNDSVCNNQLGCELLDLPSLRKVRIFRSSIEGNLYD